MSAEDLPESVELLRFAVPAAERDAFVEIEAGIWTEFLLAQPGFVGKEVWFPRDGDDVVVVIWWRTHEEWKAITAEQCAEVDARMGEWLRPIVVEGDYRLIRRV